MLMRNLRLARFDVDPGNVYPAGAFEIGIKKDVGNNTGLFAALHFGGIYQTQNFHG
jgi:hypothetical protein